jgi:hypothetical protein
MSAPQRSVDGNILFLQMAAIVMRPVGKYSGILRIAVRGRCGYNAQALARPSCHRQQVGVVHDNFGVMYNAVWIFVRW